MFDKSNGSEYLISVHDRVIPIFYFAFLFRFAFYLTCFIGFKYGKTVRFVVHSH